MCRSLIVLALIVVAPHLLPAQGNEPDSDVQPSQPDESADLSPKDRLNADPDDMPAWRAFIQETFRSVWGLIDEGNYDEAETALNAADGFIVSLEPTNGLARTAQSRFPTYADSYQQKIDLGRTPLGELQERFEADLDDDNAFSRLLDKYSMMLSPIMRVNPGEAESRLREARDYLSSVAQANPDSESIRGHIARSERTFTSYDQTIEGAKQQQALIGQQALPLDSNIQAWANGEPLSDAAVDGKVVLIDFWAVWCGPCIAAFPHLNEWSARYGEEDFAIVGVTNFYGFRWDDELGRPVPPRDADGATADSNSGDGDDDAPEADVVGVNHGEELAMLDRFAEQHALTHRLAIQNEDGPIGQFYHVNAIPHSVLIDRNGIVRMVRVGSSNRNLADLDAMIGELVAETQ